MLQDGWPSSGLGSHHVSLQMGDAIGSVLIAPMCTPALTQVKAMTAAID